MTGPWEIGSGREQFEGIDVPDGRRVIWAPDGMEVCLVRDRGGATQDVARLIAAAPRMLEALRGLMDALTHYMPHHRNISEMAEARAILRDVQGEG